MSYLSDAAEWPSGWIELHNKVNGRAVLLRAAAIVRVEYGDGTWLVWSTDGNCTRVRETRDEIMDLIVSRA